MSNDTSVELCRAHRDELALFMGWESEPESQRFVGQNSLEEHQSQFDSEQYVYLKILSDKRPAGYILLVLSPDGRSVDFRRIVVADKDGGTGQRAIALLEAYCKSQLQRSRIWLNVYPFNHRGIYIYEKLGYRFFESEEHAGKTLLCYEKYL